MQINKKTNYQNPLSPEHAKHMAPLDSKISLISKRKGEHIRICLEKDVQYRKNNGFEGYEFEHCALPELKLSNIDTTTHFLGKTFKYPFFIEALTGGAPGTETINKNLAAAAEQFGIGMGIGSQRAMLDKPELSYTYQVRKIAPGILLLGNIGATQLASLSAETIAAMVRQIEADGLVIHLNPAQEMCQPEGDTDWSNVLYDIERICTQVPFPVVVKEIGCGISGSVARELEAAGVASIDVAGAGGTSFTRVEYHRGARQAQALFEWGIPTAESLRQCGTTVQIPLIASGGIRTGIECAKAIAMGATLTGFALPLLGMAMQSAKAVLNYLTSIGEELKRAMLLVGVSNIAQLGKTKIISSAESNYS